MRITLIMITALTLIAGIATAGTLTEGDFVGVTPETFDGYDIATNVQDVDFGPFSIEGYFDSYAYYMPFVAPVTAPAIGGDTLVITMHPPVPRAGFHMGTQWGGIHVRFIGGADQILAEYLIDDFAPYGTGINGYYHQGFIGHEDDGGELIHRIELGSGDQYIDNLYTGFGPVSTDEATWGSVKGLFR